MFLLVYLYWFLEYRLYSALETNYFFMLFSSIVFTYVHIGYRNADTCKVYLFNVPIEFAYPLELLTLNYE